MSVVEWVPGERPVHWRSIALRPRPSERVQFERPRSPVESSELTRAAPSVNTAGEADRTTERGGGLPPRPRSGTTAIWDGGHGIVQGRANRVTARQVRVQRDCSARSGDDAEFVRRLRPIFAENTSARSVYKKTACPAPLDSTPLTQPSPCTSTSGIGHPAFCAARDAHKARPFPPHPTDKTTRPSWRTGSQTRSSISLLTQTQTR